LQTTTRVVGVFYILLAAVSVVFIDLRIVLIPTASGCIILLLAGFLVFRRLSGALAIPWPASSRDSQPQGVIVIEETALPFEGYDQELIVAVHVSHLPELLACVALSAAALWVMIFVPNIEEGVFGLQIGAYEVELICGIGLAVLVVSVRWFAERRILSRSHYTVGILLTRDPGFLRRGITYQYWDNKHDRQGGQGPLWGRGSDNAVLVLYDPKNPDQSTTHGAFLFHRFRLALIPARGRQEAAIKSGIY
jgi:hypothetical protein